MVRLICSGDLLLADRQHTLGIGVFSKISNNNKDNWISDFNDYDPSKDIIFCNLEAPLIQVISTKNSIREAFAADIKFAPWLSRKGFEVVSVANNHILEHGEKGFKSTLDALKKANLKPVGIRSHESGSNLIFVNKQDIRVGFAAFNAVHDITPNNSYAELNETNLIKAIKDLNTQNADVICLSLHWGNEYIHIPSWKQIQLARKAIDCGADIIIGHHPHVIQPVEEYKNGVIIYSLGNYLFDMLWSKQVRSGMTVECVLNKDGVQSYKVSLVDIQKDYTPVIREDDKWLNNLIGNNLKLMLELFEQGRDEYEKYYFKKLKKNRLKARLGMKKQLLMQWPLLPKAVKKQIIKGIFKKVKKR